MLINPFLIVLTVIVTSCTFYSSVKNLTHSEQQQLSHTQEDWNVCAVWTPLKALVFTSTLKTKLIIWD